MPGRATVTGVLRDINNQPIVGGKIIATMVGTDTFELGARIASGRVSATTGPDGSWEIELIVNAEGADKSTSWTVAAHDPVLTPIFEVEGLFIASGAAIRLDHLQAASEANRQAAQDETFVRVLTAPSYDDYLTYPDQHDDDIILLIDADEEGGA